MRLIWVIVRKEWAEVFKNRFVLFTMVFLPLILTFLPIFSLVVGGDEAEMGDLKELGPAFNLESLCAGVTDTECLQIFIVSQFMMLFMLIPLVIPITIAAYSIVGEKTTRTLEPVLATPISTFQLLMGKAFAAAIPAIVATWLGYFVFVMGVSIVSAGPVVVERVLVAEWLIAVFIVGPLLAVAAVSVAVMVSSRTNDPRVAEQLSMLVVLPLMGLFFAQVAGLVLIDTNLILWLAVALVVIDAGLLGFATQLFERETILTRWK